MLTELNRSSSNKMMMMSAKGGVAAKLPQPPSEEKTELKKTSLLRLWSLRWIRCLKVKQLGRGGGGHEEGGSWWWWGGVVCFLCGRNNKK